MRLKFIKPAKSICLILLGLTVAVLIWPKLTPAQSGGWYYYVKPGDTLFGISRKVGLSVSELQSANGLWTSTLHTGEKIFVPTVTTSSSQSYGRTGNDVELIARLITGEATGEPFTGQVAVGAVILNRTNNPHFPRTVASVIYEPNAFESVSNGLIWSRPVTSSARRAAENCLSGWDPSDGAIYFFNPAKTNSPYMWSRRIITQIGHHIFAR